MTDETKDRALMASNAVLAAFEDPSFAPDELMKSAQRLNPALKRDEIIGAAVSLLNRGKLTLGWDGRITRES